MAREPQKPMINPGMGSFFRKREDMRIVSDYEWIDDYNNTKALQAEIADLKDQRKKTAELPSAKADALKILKGFYNQYAADRRRNIQEALENVRPNHNPFDRLDRYGQISSHFRGSIELFGYLTWQEIVDAVEAMDPDPAAISDKDRERALKHIDGRLEKLQKELDEIYPSTSRFRMGADDIREMLILQWINIQKKIDSPVNPMGVTLDLSDDREKEAYKRLKIGKFVSKDARFRACNPY